MSEIMDVENDALTEMKSFFLVEFQKLNRTIENHAETLHKRIDVVEAKIARERAISPGEQSMNGSITLPRTSQPVTLHLTAPQTRQVTQKKSQPKYASLSYAQAVAASKIPISAIRNIRIMGEYKAASATALRLKNDKRFIDCGIREISQKSRFNFTLKCKTEADALKIHNELAKTYGDALEIKPPRESMPMIKITNIAEEIEDPEECERTIRMSNFWATDLAFRITDHYAISTAAGKYTNVILETDIYAQKIFL